MKTIVLANFTTLVTAIVFGTNSSKSSMADGKIFEGALSGLRQFLATERHLKMLKSAFHFNQKAPFFLKILKFLF